MRLFKAFVVWKPKILKISLKTIKKNVRTGLCYPHIPRKFSQRLSVSSCLSLRYGNSRMVNSPQPTDSKTSSNNRNFLHSSLSLVFFQHVDDDRLFSRLTKQTRSLRGQGEKICAQFYWAQCTMWYDLFWASRLTHIGNFKAWWRKLLQDKLLSLLLSNQKKILKRGMTWIEQKPKGTAFKLQSIAIANQYFRFFVRSCYLN